MESPSLKRTSAGRQAVRPLATTMALPMAWSPQKAGQERGFARDPAVSKVISPLATSFAAAGRPRSHDA
jgi:hypothetical protein